LSWFYVIINIYLELQFVWIIDQTHQNSKYTPFY
jgi:hypothetical protein